ncbi:hypothetical protein O2W14_18205 [Modestobacter sp. VKM Ac-2986]|uniref:hypothetical protein n=1 Tax=Modestobacter sp. VKM Ac-2986 TaxID=3004140 RepID=UPI0022AB9860|nr:hypothetical protein [Modestobacter sp. VKM Ac-2986]MCZ2830777.1 hypothetical protein [Modestobacter sp. VKM Ac-2986]
MTSPNWEALVEEGIRLAQADSPPDRWVVGDLCIAAVPPGSDRATRSAAQRLLEDFAGRTGLTLGLIKDCHRTSAAWPPGSRFLDISHAKHSKYAARPNRVDLLLNDEMDDNLSGRVRDQVARVEELLTNKDVQQAVLTRSRERSRRVVAAARAIESEQLTKARAELRLQEQQARADALAPELNVRLAERAIKGNVALSRMVVDLLELSGVIDQLPRTYRDRFAENLEQIQRAAQRVLDELHPETRSPQPGYVIDLDVD